MEVIIDDRLEEFIKSLTNNSIAKCRHMMGLLASEGRNLKMPHCKKIHSKIWELRVRGDQEVRIFYEILQNKAYLNHGFIKKSNKTPKKELEIAVNRSTNLK